jgi:ammonia channel protein AmtB
MMPLVANVWVNPTRNLFSWLAFLLLLGWLGWCLRGWWTRSRPDVGRIVAGLLAGIVLVDCAIGPSATPGMILSFIGLFLLARLLQRTIPAT